MIRNKNNSEHYSWGDNCSGWFLVNTPELSVIEELMPPNTAEKEHCHQFAQQYFEIKSGIATFKIEEEIIEVPSGSGIHISPRTKHCIFNNGKSDLEFVVISQPNTGGDRIEAPFH